MQTQVVTSAIKEIFEDKLAENGVPGFNIMSCDLIPDNVLLMFPTEEKAALFCGLIMFLGFEETKNVMGLSNYVPLYEQKLELKTK